MRPRWLLAVLAPLLGACGGGKSGAPPIASLDVKPAPNARPLPVEAPCDAPERILRRAKRDITLVVYAPLDGAHEALVAKLRKITARWASLSNGRVKTDFVDTSTEEGRAAAKERGLVAEGEEGLTGVGIAYGDESDAVKRLSPARIHQAEALVLLKLREVLEKADHVKLRVGVVTGHDEIALSDANLLPSTTGQSPKLANILHQYFPALELVDVDLGKADADGSLVALVVTQPQKDWTDAELRRLDAFVMRGKHLLVVASAVEIPYGDATMHAKLVTHGLEKVLARYGVQQRKDAVIDFGKHFTVAVWTANGQQNLRLPALLEVGEDRIDPSFVLSVVEPLSFPLASSLVLEKSAQPDASFRVVARSTPLSMRQAGATVDLSPMRRWTYKEGEGEQIVAAAVDGTLESAFGAGKSQRPAHVAVLSSSQFFANPLARAGAPPKTSPLGMHFTPQGDEMLEQLAMPYAQQQITNTILAAKVMILDWAAHDEDVSCVLR